MINRLSLINFRSHRSTVLNFSPYVNVIVGLPSSGKTNIFRAEEWVRTNRPSGFRFHSRFAKEKDPTVVEAVSDGRTVTMSKVGDSGTYTVDGQSYSGLRGAVPEEVSSALRMTDLNVQKQLSTHFLVTETPGEVARVLNRIIRIEEVDGWVKGLTTDINEANGKAESLREELVRLRVEVKGYDGLPVMDRLVQEVEVLDTDRFRMEGELSAIQELVGKGRGYDKDINELDGFLKVEEYIVEAERLYRTRQDLEGELGDVTTLLTRLRSTTTILRDVEAKLGVAPHLEKAEALNREGKALSEELNLLVRLREVSSSLAEEDLFLDGLGPQLEELEGIRAKKVKIVQESDEVISLMISLRSLNGQLEEKEGVVLSAEGKYQGYLKEIGACPTCGTPFTEKAMKRMVA